MIEYFNKLVAARREQGASAVEYGLMVAAIAAIIVGVVFALGTIVDTKFSDTCAAIEQGNAPTAPADSDCS